MMMLFHKNGENVVEKPSLITANFVVNRDAIK